MGMVFHHYDTQVEALYAVLGLTTIAYAEAVRQFDNDSPGAAPISTGHGAQPVRA